MFNEQIINEAQKSWLSLVENEDEQSNYCKFTIVSLYKNVKWEKLFYCFTSGNSKSLRVNISLVLSRVGLFSSQNSIHNRLW